MNYSLRKLFTGLASAALAA
ncbi:YSIRK-type signal peptide-containing protein [Filimonas zeae]